MLRPIFNVAKATFHEAWRRRFLNGILVFAVLMIGSSRLLMYMQPGAELNLLIDIGLGSIRFFGMLIAVFLGARIIFDEIDKRTIHTILAKPVSRGQFLIGKFIGCLATVWSNMVTAPRVAEAIQQENRLFSLDFMYANVAKAIGMSFMEMLVLTALAVTFSTIFSWILATIITFFIYFVGQMSEVIHQMANPERGASPVAAVVLGTIYRILPHFEIFDLREAIFRQQYVPWEHLGKVVIQAGIYMFVVIVIGYLFFNQREV